MFDDLESVARREAWLPEGRGENTRPLLKGWRVWFLPEEAFPCMMSAHFLLGARIMHVEGFGKTASYAIDDLLEAAEEAFNSA